MTSPPRRPGPLARHFLAEYYGCASAALDDPALLEVILREAVAAARTTLVEVRLHRFAPQGVSGVVVLAESHLAVHTWPELGFAAVELFVCGPAARPEAGLELLRARLEPAHVSVREVPRGDPALLARFGQDPRGPGAAGPVSMGGREEAR